MLKALFGRKTILQRWRFFGEPTEPGRVLYTREGTRHNSITAVQHLAIATSKSLYTINDPELAFEIGKLAQHAASIIKERVDGPDSWNAALPQIVQGLNSNPIPLLADVTNQVVMPLYRTYLYEHLVDGDPKDEFDAGRLQTSWPREYSPADFLSIFRVMSRDYFIDAVIHGRQGEFGSPPALVATALYGLGSVYVSQPGICKQLSSVVEVPRRVIMGALAATVDTDPS